MKFKNHIDNTFPTVILSRMKKSRPMCLYDVACYLAKNNKTLVKCKNQVLKFEIKYLDNFLGVNKICGGDPLFVV